MARVVVTHYTDPWSVWCWALEPQLLRLRERHGDKVEMATRLGAIVESPIGDHFPREEIHRMFHAARRSSGMPLDPDVILKPLSGTTVRAGIAAKAVGLVDPDRFARYLRALREAALVDARNIEELDVQEAVAREVGVDVAAFSEAMESDEATREFYGDQAEARVRGITGFPTVTFRGPQGVEVGVGGFQQTEAFESALRRVTGAQWVELPPPDPVDLLRRHGPLATREVAETCDWMTEVATEKLLALEREGLVTRQRRAGGFFWTAVR